MAYIDVYRAFYNELNRKKDIIQNSIDLLEKIESEMEYSLVNTLKYVKDENDIKKEINDLKNTRELIEEKMVKLKGE